LGVYVEYVLLNWVISALNQWGFTDIANGLSLHGHKKDAADVEQASLQQPLVDQVEETIDWANYVKHVALWLTVVQSMKACMVVLIVFEAPQLMYISSFVLGQLSNAPQLKLVFVMILTPGVMNSLQFWLQDNIFVSAANKAEAKQREAEEAQRQLDEAKDLLANEQKENADQKVMRDDEVRQAQEQARNVAEEFAKLQNMQNESKQEREEAIVYFANLTKYKDDKIASFSEKVNKIDEKWRAAEAKVKTLEATVKTLTVELEALKAKCDSSARGVFMGLFDGGKKLAPHTTAHTGVLNRIPLRTKP